VPTRPPQAVHSRAAKSLRRTVKAAPAGGPASRKRLNASCAHADRQVGDRRAARWRSLGVRRFPVNRKTHRETHREARGVQEAQGLLHTVGALICSTARKGRNTVFGPSAMVVCRKCRTGMQQTSADPAGSGLDRLLSQEPPFSAASGRLPPASARSRWPATVRRPCPARRRIIERLRRGLLSAAKQSSDSMGPFRTTRLVIASTWSRRTWKGRDDERIRRRR
jgi:hypothetical protein